MEEGYYDDLTESIHDYADELEKCVDFTRETDTRGEHRCFKQH